MCFQFQLHHNISVKFGKIFNLNWIDFFFFFLFFSLSYSNIIANSVFWDEDKVFLTLHFHVCKLVEGHYFRMKLKVNCRLILYISQYITL
jgi:hypothetical protein